MIVNIRQRIEVFNALFQTILLLDISDVLREHRELMKNMDKNTNSLNIKLEELIGVVGDNLISIDSNLKKLIENNEYFIKMKMEKEKKKQALENAGLHFFFLKNFFFQLTLMKHLSGTFNMGCGTTENAIYFWMSRFEHDKNVEIQHFQLEFLDYLVSEKYISEEEKYIFWDQIKILFDPNREGSVNRINFRNALNGHDFETFIKENWKK